MSASSIGWALSGVCVGCPCLPPAFLASSKPGCFPPAFPFMSVSSDCWRFLCVPSSVSIQWVWWQNSQKGIELEPYIQHTCVYVIYLFLVYEYWCLVFICICIAHTCSAHIRQKTVSDLLEVWMVTSHHVVRGLNQYPLEKSSQSLCLMSLHRNQVWWNIAIIQALGRLCYKNHSFQSILGYKARLCHRELKKNKKV